MEDLESIATESGPSSIREGKISFTEGIVYGSITLTIVGAYMTMFKDVYDIGMGLMIAGPVIFTGAIKKYLSLNKNSE